MPDIALKLTVSALDSLRDKLIDALDAVEEMSRNVTESRADTAPDTWGVAGDTFDPDTTLEEAMELYDHLTPMRVRGYAIVRDVFAVRVPISTDEYGMIDDEEIKTFPTLEEAQDFIRSVEAAPNA